MRIISGKLRGKRFDTPKSFKSRPTTDMAKESLFNILMNYYSSFEELEILDLYAGTGSISYEFASRGCNSVSAVELYSKNSAYIKSMTTKLGIEKQVKVYTKDVFRFAEQIGKRYDLIFADPPYDLPNLNDIPDQVFDNNILTDDGLFVLEHGPTQDFSNHKYFSSLRKYGKVHFSIFDPEEKKE